MPVISAHRWLRQVNPKLEASLGLRNKTLSKKKKNQFNGFDSSRIKGWSIFGLLITSHSSQLHLFWSRLSTVLWESDFHAQVGWGALPSSRFHSLSCISHPTVFPTALTPQDFNSGVPLIATPCHKEQIRLPKKCWSITRYAHENTHGRNVRQALLACDGWDQALTNVFCRVLSWPIPCLIAHFFF
jgi:hypothetical protein